MHLRNRRSALGALAVTGAIGAAALSGTAADASSPTRGAANALPKTMTGQVIKSRSGTLKPGSVLASKAIFSTRVFRTDRNGFALADSNGADYPVLTTNGGTTWKISGPALHVDAANAPAEVASVGVQGAKTDFAYGSGAIDVTNNGGSTWYQVFPEANVTAVVAGARGLAAYVQALNAQGVVSGVAQYVSTDGGRHWTLSNEIGG
jgi:photosystem II stability/assembly factor-like uncharacterized protein